MRTKIKQTSIDVFLNQEFEVVHRFFVLIYSNENDNIKKYKVFRYYLPKSITKNYKVIINGKNFCNHNQLILT